MNLYLSWIQSESEIKHSCQNFGKFSMNFETDKSVKFVFTKKQATEAKNSILKLTNICIVHSLTSSQIHWLNKKRVHSNVS